jgi:meso-butanediol dehydrogenase/(S,S)-butanediol dehydrogenase/diacetyl reductase
MPRYELGGKVAIVTGAGRGIGRAIALRLAREGAAVAVADIDPATASRVSDEIQTASGRAIALQVDVSKKVDTERMVQQTVAEFGRLDIMVNNAGVQAVAPLLEVDEATWDWVMGVNAKGVLFCSQAAARQMLAQGGGGRIINVVSGAGKVAPGKPRPFGVYSASKHAAMALTKQLGHELGAEQILVNAVCPGIVDTAMWDLIDRELSRQQGTELGQIKAQSVERIPLGRLEQPEDVANMVAFLASSDASYITAQGFNVCGGNTPY